MLSASDWIGTPNRFVLLTRNSRCAVLEHLRGLSPGDLYLRFCAPVSDAFLQGYVDKLNFERDVVFGILSNERLVALCHLALFDEGSKKAGEVGLSVSNGYRGRGYSSDMLIACFAEAAKHGVQSLFINYKQSNKAMAALCRKFKAELECISGEVTATMHVHDSQSLAPTSANLLDSDFGATAESRESTPRRLTPAPGLTRQLSRFLARLCQKIGHGV